MKLLYGLLVFLLPRRIYLPLLRRFLPKAVCLLFQRDGKLLAVSRKTNRSQFGLVGGKVDPGETPMQALLREVEEEAGVRPLDVRFVFEDVCVGDVTFLCLTYECADIEGTPHTSEAIDVAYVPPSILVQKPFARYNKSLFKTAGITV